MKLQKWMAAALALIMTGTIPVSALTLSWEASDEDSRRYGRVIPALILTASFTTPYRLAFLAQKEARVPVILLPAPASVDRNIYLFIPDGRDAAVIPPDELSRYISYINAKKVIVLGGPEIVDPRWRSAIEAIFPVQDIECDPPWLAAQTLANALQAPGILKRYQRLVRQEQQKKDEARKAKKAAAEKAVKAAKAEKKPADDPIIDEVCLDKNVKTVKAEPAKAAPATKTVAKTAPAVKPAAKSAVKTAPATKPVAKATPVAKTAAPAAKPTAKPAPVAKTVAKPAAPATKPVAKATPVAKPAAPAVKPTAKPATTAPATKPAATPATAAKTMKPEPAKTTTVKK